MKKIEALQLKNIVGGVLEARLDKHHNLIGLILRDDETYEELAYFPMDDLNEEARIKVYELAIKMEEDYNRGMKRFKRDKYIDFVEKHGFF